MHIPRKIPSTGALVFMVIALNAASSFSRPIQSQSSTNGLLSGETQALDIRDDQSSSQTDVLHTWTPSLVFDRVDRTFYPQYTDDPDKRAGELCQKIGGKLSPLMSRSFWKDFGPALGKGMKAVGGTVPWVVEAAVKFART